MNTIDQRILIPNAPDVVWEYISNIKNNPNWQMNCREVSFLTTFHEGRGTRWRHTSDRGRDYVIEVTTWYDGLGYEYIIVNGAPYKENRGRIRVQDTPDGTIVQWTFMYDLGGVFSGLRNAMSVRRNIETMIVESLWGLWRITSKIKSETPYTAKSMMREAPDVEERSGYTPRHPSALHRDDIPEMPSSLFIEEPPIAEDDTRPRPSISNAETLEPALTAQETFYPSREFDQLKEPDFLSQIPDAAPSGDPATSTTDFPPMDDLYERPTTAQEEEARYHPPTPIEPYHPESIDEQAPQTYQPTETTPELNYINQQEDSETDTGKVSVFDVFGLPKPSETQELRAVHVAQQDPLDRKLFDTDNQVVQSINLETSDQSAENTQKLRVGMRASLRKKRVNIRYPK